MRNRIETFIHWKIREFTLGGGQQLIPDYLTTTTVNIVAALSSINKNYYRHKWL